MNGTADAQLAALRQEYDQLRQSTDLTQVTDAVWRLAREVGGFEARVEALRQGGYVFTQSLANSARDLRDRNPPRAACQRPSVASRESTSVDERDINALDWRLDALEWSVQQINAAAFKLDQGEALIIAVSAEWIDKAAGRRDMDGGLYLTDRRVLFEQKERTGAFLGIFGGREQQARMKEEFSQWVPLTDRTIEILREMQKLNADSRYVSQGKRYTESYAGGRGEAAIQQTAIHGLLVEMGYADDCR
jgi:hypothetical protein